MNALRTGIFSLFTASSDFYTDIGGRLFYSMAPDGAELPYAVYFFVSDVDEDTFTENMKEVYVQFSLYSGASSPAEILDMDTHLAALFKDKVFTATGWTVVVMRRQQGNGPINVPADTEAGTGRYWQFDIDFQITISKT